MLQAFIVTLREGLEAFLIVAISLAYLRKSGREELVPAVHWGIGVSVVLSIGAALLFYRAANQALWEGILALVAAASRRTGRPAAELLEDFGSFIAPTLLSVYKPFVKPHWRTLDLLENTEQTIHKVVRMKNPGAAPPQLKVSRPSRDEVMIVYTSPRRLCAVSQGIAAGVARHYGERVRVTELECMHKGHRQCRISVKLLK
jgi:hypothetical protein